jgi:hypothetical protein
MMKPVICLVLCYLTPDEKALLRRLLTDVSSETRNDNGPLAKYARRATPPIVPPAESKPVTGARRRRPTEEDYLADPSLCVF